MAATLKLTHEAVGVEVRRGTYDVVVDGNRVGSVAMNDTIEMRVEPASSTEPGLRRWPAGAPSGTPA
jgi:hypothetical protein